DETLSIRDFAEPIDFDSDGTYYMSALMARTRVDDSNKANPQMYITAADSTSGKARMGIAGGGDGIFVGGGGVTPIDDRLPTTENTVYFLVMKIVTSGIANDEYFLSAYDPNEVVPLLEP